MDAYLNWPAVVLIVSLVALLLFRNEIRSLLSRLKKLSKDEAIFSDQATANQARGLDADAAEEVLKTLNGQVLIEQEERIRKDLSDRGIEDHAQRERVLVRFLALWQTVAALEQVNARIFQSQIRMLHAANDSTDGLTTDEVMPYFEWSLSDESEKNDPGRFEEWVGFLVRSRLIVQDENRYKITPIGRELLVYQIHHGHPGPKLM